MSIRNGIKDRIAQAGSGTVVNNGGSTGGTSKIVSGVLIAVSVVAVLYSYGKVKSLNTDIEKQTTILEQLRTEYKTTTANRDRINEQMTTVQGDFNGMNDKVYKLNKEYTDLVSKSSELKRIIDTQSTTKEDLIKTSKELNIEIEANKAKIFEWNQTKNKLGEMKKELNEAKSFIAANELYIQSLKNAKIDFQNFTDKNNDLKTKIQKQEEVVIANNAKLQEVKESKSTLERLTKELNTTKSTLAATKKDLEGYKGDLKSTLAELDKTEKSLENINLTLKDNINFNPIKHLDWKKERLAPYVRNATSSIKKDISKDYGFVSANYFFDKKDKTNFTFSANFVISNSNEVILTDYNGNIFKIGHYDRSFNNSTINTRHLDSKNYVLNIKDGMISDNFGVKLETEPFHVKSISINGYMKAYSISNK